MEINKINKERSREIINIIVEDRLEELNRLIEEGHLKDGDEFILTDIFTKGQWEGIQFYPGNWDIGRAFKNKVENSNLPVIRHPDGKRRDQGVVYVVNKYIMK